MINGISFPQAQIPSFSFTTLTEGYERDESFRRTHNWVTFKVSTLVEVEEVRDLVYEHLYGSYNLGHMERHGQIFYFVTREEGYVVGIAIQNGYRGHESPFIVSFK